VYAKRLSLLICAFLLSFFECGQVGRVEMIHLNVWGFSETEDFKGTFAAITEFSGKHPNIEIVLGTPGGHDSMDPQKLMTAIAAGSPPDVVLQDRFAVGGWASRSAFMPLDGMIKRDSLDIFRFLSCMRL
jgi:ABC-type glycerol-3-phosphate transport system substrate-binding protein